MEFLKKVKGLLSRVNVPLILFSAYSLRLVYLGSTFSDALTLLPLAALYGYGMLMETKKIPHINSLVVREIEELKNAVSGLRLDKGVHKKAQKQQRYF